MPAKPRSRITRSTETPPQRSRREAAQRTIGARIAELREDQDLTQAELAEKIDISMRYYQSIELGKANLTLGSLTRIAHVLRIELAEFFVMPTRKPRKAGRPRTRS